MLSPKEYTILVEELNYKFWDSKGPEECAPFTFLTDGFAEVIKYKENIVFYSEDFEWIDDDKSNFISYKEQTMNEIKNQLIKTFKEIEYFLRLL